MEKYRSRTHMILLYEDNEEHRNALKTIMGSYDYIGVLHKNDTWTIDDEKANPEHVAGTLKKAHYHIVLRFPHSTWNTAIAKELGITENFIQNVKKFDNALLYLLHYNDTDKAQYTLDDVFGPLKTRLKEIINKNEKSEGEKVVDLIEYINSYKGRITVSHFAYYCAKNGYWAEFRRSGSIFVKIIEEKNSTTL